MSMKLYSSLTKKYIMSLAGIFLMMFLLVHLTINLLIFLDDSLGMFNLQIQNWMARPKGYKKKASSETSFFSKYMIYTGILVFVFLIIHFADFLLKKIGGTVPEIHSGELAGMENMGILVIEKFKMGAYVAFYVIALIILGFHLDHSFQSAFQSLGLNHDKYTPFIKWLSHFVAIVITLGYISIPVCIYFFK